MVACCASVLLGAEVVYIADTQVDDGEAFVADEFDCEICDGHPCRWVKGGYLFLERGDLPDRPFVGSANGYANSIFDAGQFDFDGANGFEVELGRRLDDCTD
ncbi:MAG: hypothetical protein KDA41_12175, partial [Planctomycetales bacterium]|nr:hypothetical protein [Planctomycetales bacterium]